ncbi:MAG: hypothetical protein ACK56I_07030, partial [bacterium]
HWSGGDKLGHAVTREGRERRGDGLYADGSPTFSKQARILTEAGIRIPAGLRRSPTLNVSSTGIDVDPGEGNGASSGNPLPRSVFV